MGMVVQHNMNALNAYNKLNTNVAGLKKSSEKLSSGYRINRAGDDAAGLAISEKMRSQIRGLTQAKRNSQDGISMIQTFEGATQESHSILQRMKELASESANGTYQDEVDRDAIQLEFDQLNDELDQISDTDFNGVVMLNGGEMADGTKATNGKFDYVNSVRNAQQLGTAGNYVTAISKDMTDANAKAIKAETVTFTAAVADDGKVTWTASKGNLNGAVGTQDNGGFTYANASIHVDTTKVVSGDTIVLEFAPGTDAVANQAKVIGTNTDYGTTTKADFEGKVPVLTTAAVTNEKMAGAQNALDNLTITMGVVAGTKDVDIKLNGKALGADADTYAEFTKTEDGGYLGANNAGEIKYFAKGDTTGIVVGSLSNITDGKGELANNATTTGTATVDVNVTKASYTAAKGPTINLVEPDSKVSEANSNKTATAPLTYSDHMVLQTGSRTKDSVDFTFKYTTDGMGDLKSNLDLSSRANGLNTKNLSLATQEDANTAIDKIDNAINKVSMVRATFGATQNRLEHKIENLTTNAENLTEAESTIRDTDMASEMLNYTKFNVLQQAAQSMLAQANQQPQSILQLLG